MDNLYTATPIPYLSAWRWSVPVVSLIMFLSVWLGGSNQAIFLSLNHALGAFGDSFWGYVTELGDAAVLLLILPFCGRRPQVVWQFFIAALLAIAWTQSMKAPLGVMRPPAVLGADQFHLIGAALQNNSFPSGHTTTVFLVVGVLCLQRLNTTFKLALLFIAVWVGLSRIACGVHWPMDVLGGVFGGWMAAVIAQWAGHRWRFGLHPYMQRLLGLLLLGIAVWMIFRTPHDFAYTQPMQIGLAIISILWSGRGLWRLFGFRH